MKAYAFSEPDGGDVDKGWTLLAVCWAFVTCALVSTILRVWVRSRITHNMSWDDYNMIIAMTTTLLGAGFITSEVLNGLGRHEYYLTPRQRRNFQAVGWADWIQTFLTLMFTKISICLFLLRISDSRNIRLVMYSLIGSLIMFTAIFVFLFFGICRPLKAYWDVGVNGTCLSDQQIEKTVVAQGVLSIITDLICAAFPIIVLRNLQIKLRTKFLLMGLMGLGVITAACCTVRTALSGAITDPDVSWAVTTSVGWRLPEVNIGIFCANAPILRPLYLLYRGKLQSHNSTSAGFSKERILPSNATLKGNAKAKDLQNWEYGSGDTAVSVELGLPSSKDLERTRSP